MDRVFVKNKPAEKGVSRLEVGKTMNISFIE